MLKSTMFNKTCNIACVCTSAPGVPKGITELSFNTAIAGLGVSRGRFHGKTLDGWFLMAHDCDPRDDGLMPQPGSTGVFAEPSLGVIEATKPSLSTAHMYDVSKENLFVSPNVASSPHKYSSDKTDFSFIME